MTGDDSCLHFSHFWYTAYGSMVPQSYYRCWVEVDLDALRHNVAAVRRRIGPTVRLMAVVKADAYGHGLAQVASTLMQCGVNAFAVANLTEALLLRQIGGTGWPMVNTFVRPIAWPRH